MAEEEKGPIAGAVKPDEVEDGVHPEDIPRARKLPGAVRVALQAACGAVVGIALMAAFLALARYAAGLL